MNVRGQTGQRTLTKIVFDPDQRFKLFRVALVVLCVVYALCGILLLVLGIVAMITTKSMSYLPPMITGLAIVVLLLCGTSFYSLQYTPKKFGPPFIFFLLFFFAAILFGVASILLGVFCFALRTNVESKILMRWDYFEQYVAQANLTNEQAVENFISIFNVCGTALVVVGVLLLAGPIVAAFQLEKMDLIKSLFFVFSALLIIFGLGEFGVGLYLTISYVYNDPTRLSLSNDSGRLWGTLVCGLFPIVIGILGFIITFLKIENATKQMLIFTLANVVVLIIQFVFSIYLEAGFRNIITHAVDKIAASEGGTTYFNQLVWIRRYFLNEVTPPSVPEDSEEEPVWVFPDVWENSKEWIITTLGNRVHSDFTIAILCGVVVLVVLILFIITLLTSTMYERSEKSKKVLAGYTDEFDLLDFEFNEDEDNDDTDSEDDVAPKKRGKQIVQDVDSFEMTDQKETPHSQFSPRMDDEPIAFGAQKSAIFGRNGPPSPIPEETFELEEPPVEAVTLSTQQAHMSPYGRPSGFDNFPPPPSSDLGDFPPPPPPDDDDLPPPPPGDFPPPPDDLPPPPSDLPPPPV
ncbi:hypothetical protein BLNAU_2561 [Blattamonas nauphoetae]|uniref:Uncharacterized protein n=1 Tax=Blattamonas nauphoetae TaxID=2049346 RepID=A0ABQ9YF50_9EUKA|nr:hypothetical protein BLNAU_2561 [Blattamonas nauphoetae]